MQNKITDIVIIGGGTAGWITAGILAAEHNADNGQLAPKPKLNITLIESPDVATIGVGEGTWPSMRSTLQKIGISETEFMLKCDASFKQGSCFNQWQTSALGSHSGLHQYIHPFSLPAGEPQFNIAPYWLPHQQQVSFADAVGQQNAICGQHLAPKQIGTPEFSFINNYGYHLNAAKFSQLLQSHCIEKLAINHIQDHVTKVNQVSDVNYHLNSNDICSVSTTNHGDIQGDLFIDCTGTSALLIGQTLNVPFICKKQQLFNDSAIALQLPYDNAQQDIASCTHSTAQPHGWIWDIGLPTRSGIGHVYSSTHTTEQQASDQLLAYAKSKQPNVNLDKLSLKKLSISPGHRQVCWQNNCVAIGMASGFIEPLEASALALIEWTAKTVAQQLPDNRQVMDTIANRVNQQFTLHWQQIVEFLKLHYVVSNRADSDYWHDHRETNTIPDNLQYLLELWRYQVPSQQDILYKEALFPAASYQFVLYGMGFNTQQYSHLKPSNIKQAQQLFTENQQRTQAMLKVLPSNRALLNQIAKQGFSTI
ncbi:tryptophan halogenase family protein [Shewanella gaetbuli]